MAVLDVTLVRDPATGLYDLQRGSDGNPIPDSSQAHAVATQLMEYRGAPGRPGWIWDSLAGSGAPGTHGSLIYTIESDTPEERSRFKTYALSALAPLVTEGRILNPTAEVVDSATVGRIDGVVTWQTPGTDMVQTLVMPLLFP